jgi:hypothetical protein
MKFLTKLKSLIFPFVVAVSALAVSGSAAFYSVSGLSKLFAGASLEVLIMASSLEVSKLVIASLLYQYWKDLNKILRLYLTLAAFILVLITSMGIYGFLSAAYQETANKSEIVDNEINVINLKRQRFIENRDYLLSEKSSLDESVSSLRSGLSNNVVQYKDPKTGQLITTSSSANRRVLEKQLDDAISRRDDISENLESVTDSISYLDSKILEIQTNTDLAGELGPLKYLSELTKVPMNEIINYLLLIIIFVFDPLAISLVIAANFLFNKLGKDKEKDEIKTIEEEEKIEDNLIDNEIPEQENIVEQEKIKEETPQKENIEEQETTEKEENINTEEETNDLISNEVVIEGAPKKNKRLVYKKRDAQN